MVLVLIGCQPAKALLEAVQGFSETERSTERRARLLNSDYAVALAEI